MYGIGADSSLHISVAPTIVRDCIYEREESGAINHPALSGVTLSAEMLCSVQPVPYTLLCEAQNVEPLVREIRLACFVLGRRAPRNVIDSAKMSLGWFRELLRQNRPLQRRHAVLKLEVGEVIEM